jgi:hypothetical protein
LAETAQRLFDGYRRRTYDISVFNKELKGRFAQWYNQRYDHYGVLWARALQECPARMVPFREETEREQSNPSPAESSRYAEFF